MTAIYGWTRIGNLIRIATCATIVLGSLSPGGVADAHGTTHAALRPHCQRHSLTVHLSPTSPTRYQVVGWLCGEGNPRGRPVQLLISGLTYDHRYWDLPYRPDQYSYVQAAVDDHQVVFNLDRIGIGQSDHPPADLVTVPADAYVIHQVVSALRQGAVEGVRFPRVVGVAHSMGSAILMYEAAQYADVAAVVLTDYLHVSNIAQRDRILASFVPADADPRFAGRRVPAGYVTTSPGAATRLADFYDAADADPTVAKLDDAFAQTATTGELAGLALSRDPAVSMAIRVPVLVVVGQNDSLDCAPAIGLSCADAAAICQRESGYYPPAARLATFVVPDAGHSINLHYHATRWFAAAAAWIDRLPQGREHGDGHDRRDRPSAATHTCAG
jgi:alpha-beta hydrolase superfamily lysophospholipase